MYVIISDQFLNISDVMYVLIAVQLYNAFATNIYVMLCAIFCTGICNWHLWKLHKTTPMQVSDSLVYATIKRYITLMDMKD